jgi:hypothetical protein
VLGNEYIAGNAGNVFFNQCILIGEVRDAVGRQNMFQLQPVNARRIGNFDIVMVLIVVKLVHDADAEWVGITKAAIVDPRHIEVVGKR